MMNADTTCALPTTQTPRIDWTAVRTTAVVPDRDVVALGGSRLQLLAGVPRYSEFSLLPQGPHDLVVVCCSSAESDVVTDVECLTRLVRTVASGVRDHH